MTNILIVEDDADIRQLLVDVLGRAGFAPRALDDGTHVQRYAREADAVILDVSLPGRSGLDACRSLRADPATARLPVLLLSGYTTDEQIRAGLAAGADAYLVKPFSPAGLVAQLRHLVDPSAASTAALAAVASLQGAYRSGARLLPLLSAEPATVAGQHQPAEPRVRSA